MTSPKVIFACKYYLSLNSKDRYIKPTKRFQEQSINGMFNYFSDVKKKAVNMFDYFEGKINKEEKVNLVLENGEYATEEDIKKRKKDYCNYFKDSNLWLGVISFNNDYIDESIELRELEKKIAKEVMPKFLKKCGFKDMKNMSYQIALHTNTDNYHFHISFIEKKPNYILSNGKLDYRKKGLITKEERNYLKNEIIHTIDRHREFTPLVINANKEIEELKKYFKPKERNFVLRDIDDLVLEENILKLGRLLDDKRKDNIQKIKYNSIYDKDIKDLTKKIKKYLFKNKKSDLYNQEKKFEESLNKINKYFYKINKENNIKTKFKSDYSKNKELYVDNFIYNAIVNNAIYRYKWLKNGNIKGLTKDDLIQESILKIYRKKKNNSKFDILLDFLKNNDSNRFKTKRKVEQSLKNINIEMEEAVTEFSKLFKNDNEKNIE